MTARRHHYVPQFYLGGFTYNRRKPKLFCFDFKNRKSFHSPPDGVAQQRDFNRVDIPGLPPDALETALAAEETELSRALARIIECRSLASREDRSAFLHFMSILAVKNPAMRENIRSFHDQITRRVLDVLVSSEQIWDHHCRKAREAGYISDGPEVTLEQMQDFARRGEFDVHVSTEAHLAREFSMQQTILPYLEARRWMMVFAPPESAGFVTSDRPVALSWSDPTTRNSAYPPGFGLKGTQVLFPICREIVVVGSFEGEEVSFMADEDLVSKINGSTIYHSGRQIYAASGEFLYTLKIGRRVRRGVELVNDSILMF